MVEKKDFFTGQPFKLTKIELTDFSDRQQLSKKLSKSWETEVDVISSYMYDKNFVFGAQYKIEGNKLLLYTMFQKQT